jgi:hypothetical protein
VVVALAPRLVASAATPPTFSVDGPDGQPLTVSVTPLASAQTAMVVILHTPNASAGGWAAAQGVVTELVHSLPPGLPLSLVTTAGGAVLSGLTVDRAETLAALARPPASGPVAVPEALTAAAAQLVGKSFLAPLVVLIDGAPAAAPSPSSVPALPTLDGVAVRVIPLTGTPSPIAAEIADRFHAPAPAAVDPVALVDSAVTDVQSRFRILAADPHAGPVTLHVRTGSQDQPVLLTPSSTVLASTAATPASAPAPTALAQRPPVTFAPAASPPLTNSSSYFRPLAIAAVVAAAVALVLVARRRRRVPVSLLGPEPAPHVVTGFYYTDFAERRAPERPSSRRMVVAPAVRRDATEPVAPSPPFAPPPTTSMPIRPRPQPIVADAAAEQEAVRGDTEPRDETAAPNESVGVQNEPDAVNGTAASTVDRRIRVLQLAEELGNISEACRLVGVSRRSYYEWKRIADAEGVDALTSRRRRPRP